MEISYYKTELVKIDDLIEFQGELKELSNINLEKLWKSMEDSGFSEPFVVWESKKKIYVLGGHQRLKALKAKKNLGENVPDEFPCNFVRCAGKREAKKLLLALASQFGKVTEDGLYSYAVDNDFDIDFLKENFEFPSLDINQFESDFFDNSSHEDTEKDDEIPEVSEGETICKKGDLWLLGEHRLLCGDCTDEANVKRLMNGKNIDMVFTDPPYGVSIGDKNKLLDTISKARRIKKNIVDDTLSPEELKRKLVLAFSNIKKYSNDKCSYFVTAPQGGELGMMMLTMMKESGLAVRHMIIWVKNRQCFSMGRLDYEYKHEPILYTWNKTHKFYGKGKYKNSVWEIDKEIKCDIHPTMKPVELITNALLNNSVRDNIIADFFLGSGSTLIACEKTKRICYGTEIDEHYCDVIIKRWEDYTGLKAEKVER